MSGTERRGFTITELLVIILIAAMLLGAVLPALGRGRSLSGVQVSFSNLMAMGFAHAVYAADYDGRQVTLVVDNLSAYGSSAGSALSSFLSQHGEGHPNILAGWGPNDQGEGAFMYRYVLDGGFSAHTWACQPIHFYGSRTSSIYGFGNFRFRNSMAFSTYFDGRWYGEAFYAPNDREAFNCVEEVFDSPYSLVPPSLLPCANAHAWTSYCFSPAALYHQDVFALNEDTGDYFTDPWSIDHGLNTPGLYQTRYPDLKTQVVEHNWNQQTPADICNPAIEGGTYGGCEPYYFNHALASEPATLFYDMSVRLLPNDEALAADAQLMSQSGHGTWSRDSPMGEFGYFGEFSYDGLVLSHHIFTIDGILGRDTLHGISPQPSVGRAPVIASGPVEALKRMAPGSGSPASLLPE